MNAPFSFPADAGPFVWILLGLAFLALVFVVERAMFLHRRKFLRSQVISAMQELLTKEQVDAVLAQENLEPNLRAEQLTVERMIALLEACRTSILPSAPS